MKKQLIQLTFYIFNLDRVETEFISAEAKMPKI